jgi:hypothetical protein
MLLLKSMLDKWGAVQNSIYFLFLGRHKIRSALDQQPSSEFREGLSYFIKEE